MAKEHYKSEYNMGMFDFERFHRLLMTADNYAFLVRMYDVNAIYPYYSILKQLYINFRPVIFEAKRVKLDKEFNDVYTKLHGIAKRKHKKKLLKMDVIDDLENLHMILLDIRQDIGLGLVVNRSLSSKKKLERVLS